MTKAGDIAKGIGAVFGGLLVGAAAVATAVSEADQKKRLTEEKIPQSLAWLHRNFGITEQEVYDFLKERYYKGTLRR